MQRSCLGVGQEGEQWGGMGGRIESPSLLLFPRSRVLACPLFVLLFPLLQPGVLESLPSAGGCHWTGGQELIRY